MKINCCTNVSIQAFNIDDVFFLNTTKLRCIQGFKKCRLGESARDQKNGVMTTNGIKKTNSNSVFHTITHKLSLIIVKSWKKH